MSFSMVFLLFIAYSFIGWVLEVAYCSAIEHRFVNRGFLHGPLCPVYGFGGLLLTAILEPVRGNLPLLFVSVFVLTSALEYLTGWILETIFATKWWDYSSYPFNLHGRVCLLNSSLFGVAGVVAVNVVHPVLLSALESLSAPVAGSLALVAALILTVDTAMTVTVLLNLDRRLASLHSFTENLKERMNVLEWLNESDLAGSLERLKALALADASGALGQLSERYERLARRIFGLRRLARAFPAMRSRRHALQLESLKALHSRIAVKHVRRAPEKK